MPETSAQFVVKQRIAEVDDIITRRIQHEILNPPPPWARLWRRFQD